jgi:hypothetical protein
MQLRRLLPTTTLRQRSASCGLKSPVLVLNGPLHGQYFRDCLFQARGLCRAPGARESVGGHATAHERMVATVFGRLRCGSGRPQARRFATAAPSTRTASSRVGGAALSARSPPATSTPRTAGAGHPICWCNASPRARDWNTSFEDDEVGQLGVSDGQRAMPQRCLGSSLDRSGSLPPESKRDHAR